jgi:hypothetical protein
MTLSAGRARVNTLEVVEIFARVDPAFDDCVDAGVGGPVTGAAERATAWCQYLEAHARRLYATVTDRVRVAAALLASRMARGRLSEGGEANPHEAFRQS